MNTRTPRTPLSRLALASTATCLALLAACSSMPAQNAALTQARARLDAAQSRPETVAMAPDELARARESLRRADQALMNGDSVNRVNHLSYLTQQQVAIAEETAAGRNAQAVVTGAAAERDRMRLELRTREADTAQAQKDMAEQDSAAKTLQLARSEANTQAERDRVARRDVKVNELELQLHDMNARRTDRGVIVTLGDLLFDTGASELRSTSQHRMDQLAGFMKRYPERHASIEGYTDNVGKAAANQSLSDRRANAVMAALIQLGVPGTQLSTQSFGEEHPVAPNNTQAGRQMNRRVEVVFAREAGDVVQK